MKKETLLKHINKVLPKVNNIKLNKEAAFLVEDIKAHSIFVSALRRFYKDCGSVDFIYEIEIKVKKIIVNHFSDKLEIVIWSLIVAEEEYDFSWQSSESKKYYIISDYKILEGLNAYEDKGYKYEKLNNELLENVNEVLPNVDSIQLNKESDVLLNEVKAYQIFIEALRNFYKNCISVDFIKEIKINVNKIIVNYFSGKLDTVIWSLIAGEDTYDFIWQSSNSKNKFIIEDYNILEGLNVFENKGYKYEKLNVHNKKYEKVVDSYVI